MVREKGLAPSLRDYHAGAGKCFQRSHLLTPPVQVPSHFKVLYTKKAHIISVLNLLIGAREGTWTPTVSRWNLNPVRLPVPPLSHWLVSHEWLYLSSFKMTSFSLQYFIGISYYIFLACNFDVHKTSNDFMNGLGIKCVEIRFCM